MQGNDTLQIEDQEQQQEPQFSADKSPNSFSNETLSQEPTNMTTETIQINETLEQDAEPSIVSSLNQTAEEEQDQQQLAEEEQDQQQLAEEEQDQQQLAEEEQDQQQLAEEVQDQQQLAEEGQDQQQLAEEGQDQQQLAEEGQDQQQLAEEKEKEQKKDKTSKTQILEICNDLIDNNKDGEVDESECITSENTNNTNNNDDEEDEDE
jgi:hypothetical protein